MRKLYITIVSLALCLIMCLSALAGCNLVTTDNERDMNQVVATVNTGDGAPTESIYKKDMVTAYLNYYYAYEQYGYSRAQVYKMVIDNLINNKVLVQYVIRAYAEKAGDTDIEWVADNYLSTEEKEDVLYSAYKEMNDLIDNYVTEKEDEKVGDTLTEKHRAVPTGAQNDEELTAQDKRDYVSEGIDVTSEERRKAFTKVVNLLKQNDLLGDNYVANDITTTEYYKKTYKELSETKLVEKYRNDIEISARAKVTFNDVLNEYTEIYNAQKENDNASFVAGLDGASATAPILYSAYNGYGFAYNLLLGASEELKAEFNAWKAENPNASTEVYNAKREEIYSKITVKDYRSYWINSGYDFDDSTNKFTGDYTLTSAENSLAFKGEVVELTPAGAEDKEYRATATEMTLAEFIPYMEEYIYGTAKGGAIADNREVNATTANSEYEKRVKELIFAFSTDDSETALNTYKGYCVKPIPDGANPEEFVIEYATAGRKLMNMGKYSYVMVASDYGYHVMFFSEKIDATYDYPTLISYLNKQYGVNETETYWENYYNEIVANWEDVEDTDNYLYVILNALATDAVEKAFDKEQKAILNEYVYSGSDYVVKYEDRYADLLA